MVRENQRTLTGDKNTIFGIHSVSLQVVDFLQHCFGANNCTVTDVALDVRMHNTAFAFVAPLSADNDYIFTHFILLKN